MTRVDAPLSSEIAAVSGRADGSAEVTIVVEGGRRLALRLDAGEVEKLAGLVRVRESWPVVSTWPNVDPSDGEDA
jgi:hypothetical protein